MKLRKTILSGCTIFLSYACLQAEVLTPSEVIRLKKVEVGSELMTEIIKSNAIYRALVSVNGIEEMKKAGVTDQDIIALIRAGNPTVELSADEDDKDFKLSRELARKEQELSLLKKKQTVLRENLVALFTNPDLLKLVESGKVQSEDYRKAILYLKQFAAGEESEESNDSDQINVDIKQ